MLSAPRGGLVTQVAECGDDPEVPRLGIGLAGHRLRFTGFQNQFFAPKHVGPEGRLVPVVEGEEVGRLEGGARFQFELNLSYFSVTLS